MPNLALLDLVTPYLLRGENLGAQHAALSALRVVELDSAADDLGVMVRGRCEFNGYLRIDTSGSGLRIDAGVDEGASAFDPGRRSPVFDIRETAVDFELFVPRAGSAIVAGGAAGIAAAAFTPTRDVLDAWDTLPLDQPLSDYPASGFVLDLLLAAPTVRPPFLHPAKLDTNGMLTPDASIGEVALRLPKLRFRLTHGNATGSQLAFDLVSLGSATLDDPADFGVAELVSMEPPYAFIGGANDRVVGIGFRSATLDLSNEITPPAVMAKTGVGDDWTGLYLPEVRVFIAPEGARDFAFEAGARELLIGFGAGDGLWGDFEAMLVNQGSGELKLSARFFDAAGKAYGIERVSDTEARARIPAVTRMVVDVVGGRTPYARQVKVGAGAAQAGMAFNVDLSGTQKVDIVVTVTDGSATPLNRTLTIHAERRSAIPVLPTPGPAPTPSVLATLNAPADTPKIVLAAQSDTQVTLATEPADPTLRWRVDGGAETPAQPSLTIELAPGATRQVQVRKPGSAAPATLDVFYYFDEPKPVNNPADEAALLRAYAALGDNLSTVKAVSPTDRTRLPGHQDPIEAHRRWFEMAPAGSTFRLRGHASYEGRQERSDKQHNHHLARRRAAALRERIRAAFPAKNFNLDDATPSDPAANAATVDAWVAASGWLSHGAPNQRDWWLAKLELPPGLADADDTAQASVTRPAAPALPPPVIPPVDPPVPAPKAPDWFRSVKLKLRVVRSQLIAGELEGEIDFQTATEQKLAASGQLGGNAAPQGHTLANGAPIGQNNPADGITRFRLLCQHDPAVGRTTTSISVGADPADKSGLGYFGWLPGDPVPANKDFGVTLLGSYLSFWPMLAGASAGGRGAVGDAVLVGAALATPGVIAALPWFQVERVIVFGGEYLQRDRGDEFEGHLLFDVGIDWSANILDLIKIEKDHPLSVRYKAIGLRFGNRGEDGTAQFQLRPVFDSSRGYTIDLASGGALKIAEPLGQILRVLGARLSRTNPLTFEIDVGLGVDLGVVRVDRAGVRAYLDEPRPPELTALAASVDIPGALVGSGYLQIGSSPGPGGVPISTIGGQIDLTLRPLSLRVAAALEIANIPAAAGGPATGVYVGLNVTLPVGLPLGSSGLGIFGFRGIFGMHYERNPAIGAGQPVQALEWLKAAGGQPHRLVNPATQVKLWAPHVDRWSFGLGMLIGTMEGGVIMNLDGTLLLELPGPRVLIMMNARIVSPPPSLDGIGSTAGILAVIEITPEHFLIGIVVQWEVPQLVKIVIPVEAVFPFGSDAEKWHIYLGTRSDIPPRQPVELDVLGIVKGTGYLMFKGDGLPAFPRASLPEIRGFGIGLGVAASFTWGNTNIGLYLRVGGGMDAVLGLDPFVLAGTVYVTGELRLFIVSIGAEARLTVIVNEQPGGQLKLYVHGEACGKVSFLFFEVKGCVDITIAGPSPAAPMPVLVDKVSIKSRSPALLQGTGIDRGMDASLGDALAQGNRPAKFAPGLPVVPVDAIPVVSMKVPPVAAAGLTVGGLGTAVSTAPGVPAGGYAERGGEKYRYELVEVWLERIDPASGAVAGPAIQGSGAPAVWWTLQDATGSNATAQLALLTWEPTPATKAIEKTERLEETIIDRWGRVCSDAAPPADVLWTFRWEAPGASPPGWDLEGMAWPDPDGTRRSAAPDTKLHVFESWRSGDAPIDMARGIFPALVVGGLVPCWKAPAPPQQEQPPGPVLVGPVVRPPVLTPSLVVGGLGALRGVNESLAVRRAGLAVAATDPVFGVLVKSATQQPLRISPALHAKVSAALVFDRVNPLAPADLARQLQRGEAPPRQDLLAAFQPAAMTAPTPTASAAATRHCQVRLLEAPMLDDGRLVPFGDPADEERVKAALEQRGIQHGPLDDVVVLDTGPLQQIELLLFVRRDLLDLKRVVVRVVDAAGNQLAVTGAGAADLVPPKPLPAHWTDPTGPWVDDIAELLAFNRPGWLPVFLRLTKQPKAAQVQIGTLPAPPVPGAAASAAPKQMMPAYFVAAIGAVRGDEVARFEWDQSQIDRDRQVLTQVLGPASSSNALLFADSLYRLTVRWHGRRDGDGRTLGSAGAPQSQTFWFQTDAIIGEAADPPKPVFTAPVPAQPLPAGVPPAPHVPVRLDPWMLVTLPAERELHVFGGEPVRLVFNTHDVDRVFAAYGKELRLRFSAASSRHPAPLGVKHPFPLNAQTLVPVKAAVLSPWEDVVGQVMQGSCIPVDENRTRHSMVDVPIPLEPFTDYLLDVEIVPLGAPDSARGPVVMRRRFSTGGHATLAGFAAALQAPRVTARYCEPGAMEAIRAHFNGREPQGPELDDQFRAQGLEPLGLPEAPRVVVFWQQQGNAAPQPAAVLIDANEPMFRSRPYPQELDDTTGPVPAKRWVLADTEWLTLQDMSAAGVVAAGGVVRGPGGQRALVVLAPNARGKTLKIDLVSRAFPLLPFLNQAEQRATLVETRLDRAPWEE